MSSHLPRATLAHLHAKAGNKEKALLFSDEAKKLGGTPHEQALMMDQIYRLLELKGN